MLYNSEKNITHTEAAPGSRSTVEKSREELCRRNKDRKTLPLPKTPLDEMLDRHRSTNPIHRSLKPQVSDKLFSTRGNFRSKEDLRRDYKHRPPPKPQGSTNVYETIPALIMSPSMRSPVRCYVKEQNHQDKIESEQSLYSHQKEQEPADMNVYQTIHTLLQQGQQTSASNSYQPLIVQYGECDENEYMTISRQQ